MEISQLIVSQEVVLPNCKTLWHKGTNSTTWLPLPGITIVKKDSGLVSLRVNSLEARRQWVKYTSTLLDITAEKNIVVPLPEYAQTIDLEPNKTYQLIIFCTPVTEVGITNKKTFTVKFTPQNK